MVEDVVTPFPSPDGLGGGQGPTTYHAKKCVLVDSSFTKKPGNRFTLHFLIST